MPRPYNWAAVCWETSEMACWSRADRRGTGERYRGGVQPPGRVGVSNRAGRDHGSREGRRRRRERLRAVDTGRGFRGRRALDGVPLGAVGAVRGGVGGSPLILQHAGGFTRGEAPLRTLSPLSSVRRRHSAYPGRRTRTGTTRRSETGTPLPSPRRALPTAGRRSP